MATLTYKKSKIGGSGNVAMAAASVGGDKVSPNPRGALLVKNGDASSKTVTVVVPGNTRYGQAQPDVAVVIPASEQSLIGPFGPELAGGDGLVAITYSGVTSVTVAAVQI